MRLLRRFLLPFAVVVIAAALGTFVLGRVQVAASSTAMQNPGMKLTSATSLTNAGMIAAGRTLFTETCSTCHGGAAQGSVLAPSLLGVGGATVDLWLTAGWMPLRTPETQPEAKPVYLTPAQIDDIVAYVVSLKPGGVPVPTNVSLKNANAAEGFAVFALNCAPCHTITGSGDALASGVSAPSLHLAKSATMVLEAIRTGPQNMPRFGPGDISDQQALDVALYVTKYIKSPRNIGGIGLGGVGPVAEGFVGLFVGVGVCLLAAYWVGDRTARDDEDEHGHSDSGHDVGDDDEGEPAAAGDEAGEAAEEVGGTTDA
ncbi:MAG: c-type cytochrome [Acidimicrobiales bacterium]|jgi:ubiquinol-cytochrome c reductase cytochrome c subunit